MIPCRVFPTFDFGKKVPEYFATYKNIGRQRYNSWRLCWPMHDMIQAPNLGENLKHSAKLFFKEKLFSSVFETNFYIFIARVSFISSVVNHTQLTFS